MGLVHVAFFPMLSKEETITNVMLKVFKTKEKATNVLTIITFILWRVITIIVVLLWQTRPSSGIIGTVSKKREPIEQYS